MADYKYTVPAAMDIVVLMEAGVQFFLTKQNLDLLKGNGDFVFSSYCVNITIFNTYNHLNCSTNTNNRYCRRKYVILRSCSEGDFFLFLFFIFHYCNLSRCTLVKLLLLEIYHHNLI